MSAMPMIETVMRPGLDCTQTAQETSVWLR